MFKNPPMNLSYLQMKLYHRDTGGSDDRGNLGFTDGEQRKQKPVLAPFRHPPARLWRTGDALDIRFKEPPGKGALLKRAQDNHTISSWRRNSSRRI
jgi:hypothetical protein